MEYKIAEYSATAAALADLNHRFKGVVFDVSKKEGMVDAVKARAELRGYYVSLEKMRKELKAPALERSRLIDHEAKILDAEIHALHDPIDETIKSEETRKEREREERLQAEANRKDEINAKIARIIEAPAKFAGKTSGEIRVALDQMRGIDVSTWAQEFEVKADEAKKNGVAALEQLLAGTEESEKAKAEEEARIAREREELARLRAEQEQRSRQEQARIAEEIRVRAEQEAMHRAKIEAEERASRERIEAAERIARQARDAEEAKLKAERDAEEKRIKQERDRVEAEQRKLHEEQRQARDAEEAKLREIKRQENEMLDAKMMLSTFRERFGKIEEFAPVIKAINQVLKVAK